MRTALINAYRTGLAGFCPWQWTEQLAMWQAGGTFGGENWDDFLGACVRYDQSVKPSGRFYRDFIYLFSQIEIRSVDSRRTVDATAAVLENGPGNTSGFGSDAVSVPSVPSATVQSSDGQVLFADPAIANPGDFYILHSSVDDMRHRGIACSRFSLGGYVVEAENGGDVWFVLLEGRLDKLKVQSPGLVAITSSDIPKTTVVCEGTTRGREVAGIEFAYNGQSVELDILPWHLNYWITLKY
ncbi:hypothetical protein [Micrococcus luteus]|uniref:hypothetical protein n=1 Tax=Micrococcus luteus TaxID=1270 RepID=UPI0033D803A9